MVPFVARCTCTGRDRLIAPVAHCITVLRRNRLSVRAIGANAESGNGLPPATQAIVRRRRATVHAPSERATHRRRSRCRRFRAALAGDSPPESGRSRFAATKVQAPPPSPHRGWYSGAQPPAHPSNGRRALSVWGRTCDEERPAQTRRRRRHRDLLRSIRAFGSASCALAPLDQGAAVVTATETPFVDWRHATGGRAACCTACRRGGPARHLRMAHSSSR